MAASMEDIELDATSKADEPKFNVQEWLNRVSKAREKEQAWRERAKKCVKLYRDDDSVTSSTNTSPRNSDSSENTFNILHANTETLLPALYSKVPTPDIRNRYLSQDPIAEQVGQVLERCLIYSMDIYNFSSTIKDAVKDYLLTGRAIARVRLIPQFETRTTPQVGPDGIPMLDEMGDPVSSEEEVHVGNEVRCELVPWDSFIIEPVKRWEDVNWIGFIHMLSEDEFKKYFPGKPLVEATKSQDRFETDPKYKVYEIWDKKEKKVYFIGQAEEPLKIMDDPLNLTNFWPMPEPLYSIKTSDTLAPIPEYTIYQAQAYELNQVSYRITDLVKACKFMGVYDAMQGKIEDLFNSRDSQFVPINSPVFREKGLAGIVDTLDVSRLMQVISGLYAERDKIISIIYQITGISDIIRGESKASETATAQDIKARYAGLRLRNRRADIDRFVVEILRIKAELIATFFSNQQLQEMSGIPITPEMEMLLKSDIARSYKIDIETDSTIDMDMNQQAQERASTIMAITDFIQKVSPMVQGGLVPIETAKAMLSYALQPAKISRELEDALELIGTAPPPMQNPGMPGAIPVNAGSPMPPGALSDASSLPGGMPAPMPAIQMPVA